MTIFESMWADFQDPAMRHAIVVHLPVALAMLGPIFVILMIVQPKNVWLRWIAIGCYAILAATAWYATDTGEGAEHAIDKLLSPAASEALHEHEWHADWAWKFGIAVVVILLLTNIAKSVVRKTAFVLASLAAVFMAGWVGITAHYGGTLVYRHGVNTGSDLTVVTADEQTDEERLEEEKTLDPKIVFFRNEVRPILEANCWNCHANNPENAGGNLVLTSIEQIKEGGQGGPAIVVGDADESLLIQAVRYDDPFLQMPPDEEHRLSTEEVDVLEQWVNDGAAWEPVVIESE